MLFLLLAFLTAAATKIPSVDSFLAAPSSRHHCTHNNKLLYPPSESTSLSRLRMSSSSTTASLEEVATQWARQLGKELKEVSECASIVASAVLLKPDEVQAKDIVTICDDIDELVEKGQRDAPTPGGRQEAEESVMMLVTRRPPVDLRLRAMKAKRYEYLVKLMQSDYDAYIATASFLSPSRIPRRELPNLQDVPVDKNAVATTTATTSVTAEDGTTPLVADCELEDIKYQDSLLDKLLLSIFRKLVTQNTGGVTSDKPGIEGLLEQGRTFMLQPNQTPEAQHQMVSNTLGGLMTPILPPFYRIFMSGIVPKSIDGGEGKQYGPWFYAPFLTSFVTPTFFGFLVGPSYPNRRKDGQLGGLVVDKCKFLVSVAYF